jgi:hypothetical protein
VSRPEVSVIELEEAEAGSPSAIGRRSRTAFVESVVRACECPFELRAERAFLECARCGARVFAKALNTSTGEGSLCRSTR